MDEDSSSSTLINTAEDKYVLTFPIWLDLKAFNENKAKQVCRMNPLCSQNLAFVSISCQISRNASLFARVRIIFKSQSPNSHPSSLESLNFGSHVSFTA